jgi:hypothetical protein
MTPRTVTAAPTDRGMWRRLYRLVHPDAGGSDDLFIWVLSLYEHVCGQRVEDPRLHTPSTVTPRAITRARLTQIGWISAPPAGLRASMISPLGR